MASLFVLLNGVILVKMASFFDRFGSSVTRHISRFLHNLLSARLNRSVFFSKAAVCGGLLDNRKRSLSELQTCGGIALPGHSSSKRLQCWAVYEMPKAKRNTAKRRRDRCIRTFCQDGKCTASACGGGSVPLILIEEGPVYSDLYCYINLTLDRDSHRSRSLST